MLSRTQTELALISRSPESAAAPPLSKVSNSAASTRTLIAAFAVPNKALFIPIALIEDEGSERIKTRVGEESAQLEARLKFMLRAIELLLNKPPGRSRPV